MIYFVRIKRCQFGHPLLHFFIVFVRFSRFFSHFDGEGQFSKPFVLPQEEPSFYEHYVKTFNVPELVLGTIEVKQSALARAFRAPATLLKPAGETRPPEAGAASVVVEGEGQRRYEPSMK